MILLIGPPAAGKSSVGPLLASLTNWKFVDADEVAAPLYDDDKGSEKLTGLLPAGDTHGEVATCWHAKEAVRKLYAHADAGLALGWVTSLGEDLINTNCGSSGCLAGRVMTCNLDVSALPDN